MTPLTSQEQRVKEMLVEERLAFEPHHVFDLGALGRRPVDFVVFLGAGVAIECTGCYARRGRALADLRRRSALINYWFGTIKKVFPNVRGAALIEGPSEDQERLAAQLKPILKDADSLTRTIGELREALRGLREA
jgi:hypothetical protein